MRWTGTADCRVSVRWSIDVEQWVSLTYQLDSSIFKTNIAARTEDRQTRANEPSSEQEEDEEARQMLLCVGWCTQRLTSCSDIQ